MVLTDSLSCLFQKMQLPRSILIPTHQQRATAHSDPEQEAGSTSRSSMTSPEVGNQEFQRRMRSSQNATSAQSIPPEMFESTGLRSEVFSKALHAFEQAYTEGRAQSSIVTIIDYELHSAEKRFWVIDLEQQTLLHHTHTTHGQGSDRNHDGKMDSASNQPESNQSNVGLMQTDETYTGRHGTSLKLDGIEPGFNDNAKDRHIVIHPAKYADDEYVERHGKAGRSHGCPALDPDVAGEIIDTIKGGKLVFAYYPDPQWLERSQYLEH
jgi:hypothetical protein